jgi:hypothetical protein
MNGHSSFFRSPLAKRFAALLFALCFMPASNADVVTFPAPEEIGASQIWQLEVDGQAVFCYQDFRLNRAFPPSRFGMCVSPQAFALFDFTGTVMVRAKLLDEASSDLSEVVIRPLARGIEPRITDNYIEFELDRPGDIVIDPEGTGLHALHLFSNRPETDIPDKHDPNVAYFGPGVHDIEDLTLESGQTLYLAGGAVLRPLPTRLRKPTPDRHYTGVNYERAVSAIRASGGNVTIRGRGIVSGERALPARRRFGLFRGARMTNLIIRDVVFTRSTGWTLLLYDCSDSLLERVRVLGYFTNSDGICLHSCRDCRINGCFVHTADDCYEVKSRANDVRFENCQVWCDAGTAMGVTHEIDGLVTDVTWRDMTVLHYTYPFNPYEGVTSRGSIFVHPAMGGDVRNLLFQNITIENTTTDRPLICVYNVKKPKEGTRYFPDKPYSSITDIAFTNLRAHNIQNPEILMYDEAQNDMLTGISFDDVVINGERLVDGDRRLILRGGVTGVTCR